MVTHYGPANGPDGLGQAAACGTFAGNRWAVFTLDVSKVTCRNCRNTHEVRSIVADNARQQLIHQGEDSNG